MRLTLVIRMLWRSSVRSAMHAARREPTDVDDAPAPAL